MSDGAVLQVPDDPLERARQFIERAETSDLALADLAAAADLSPYHFTRLFTARFGVSPVAYMRTRRLAAAAERLRIGAPSLIDLAFDAGFDSQEGFTRAFKRAYGVSPGRYRRSGGLSGTMEILPMTKSDTLSPNLVGGAKPERREGLRMAGLAQEFDDMNKSAIPALWGRLFQTLPQGAGAGRRTYGVCTATTEAGAMRYVAAIGLAPDEPAPADLELIDLPERAYLVFKMTIDGTALHPQMQAAAREIWGMRIPRSGCKLAQAPDLEVYPPDFKDDVAGGVLEWWIPVEPNP
jgi:AraC family transcriptional regulator